MKPRSEIVSVLFPDGVHAGPHLSPDMVRAAGAALAQHGLLPAKGYLE